jgi:SAM-dependent methyltransferase
MKKYNSKTRQLEFYSKKADAKYWDSQWQADDFAGRVACRDHPLTRQVLDKYAPNKQAKILEAGCGDGHIVYFIDHRGYKDVYGIDYAEETVKKINRHFPNLKVSCQDVRDTNFADNFFDFYFSFGVIEHFPEGYDPIIQEAKRVTRPGGYLAITFPWMSPLRRLKAKLGLYSTDKQPDWGDFYQFALNDKQVADDLARYGLELKEKIPYSPDKGLKDEISFPPLAYLIKNPRKNKLIAKAKNGLFRLTRPYASHMIMLIFQNK